MKITVITPTWNQAAYIEDTIRSVLNQTYRNFEYIIVDNCSDDGTKEIIESYMNKDNRIIYIRETDHGQAEAINKGLLRATGDVVCWINSDDYYYSDQVFEQVINYFQDTKVQVVAGDGVYCDRQGNYTEPILCDRKVEPWVLSRWYYILQPAMFWRRQQGMYLDTGYHYVFDWKFFIQLQEKYIFTFVPECFSVYRMYEDNKTGLDNASRKKEIYMLQRELGISKANTEWCRLVWKGYQYAEKTGHARIKKLMNWGSRFLFHITNKRICSF